MCMGCIVIKIKMHLMGREVQVKCWGVFRDRVIPYDVCGCLEVG